MRSVRLLPEHPVLGLDTSAKHCSVAVTLAGTLLAGRHAAMDRGQAEALFPLIRDAMGEAGLEMRDLGAIGICTGPGSFTGVRLGVAAARGLALSLGIPAIGISAFEMAALGTPGRVLAVVDAVRDCAYAKICPDGNATLVEYRELPSMVAKNVTVVGSNSVELAAVLGARPRAPKFRGGEAAAHIASELLPFAGPRPEPQYLRAAVLPADGRKRPGNHHV